MSGKNVATYLPELGTYKKSKGLKKSESFRCLSYNMDKRKCSQVIYQLSKVSLTHPSLFLVYTKLYMKVVGFQCINQYLENTQIAIFPPWPVEWSSFNHKKSQIKATLHYLPTQLSVKKFSQVKEKFLHFFHSFTQTSRVLWYFD